MTMTDPIADMLTRLRNANSAYHDEVTLPSSKIKVNIAEILKQEGYIASYEVADGEKGKLPDELKAQIRVLTQNQRAAAPSTSPRPTR